MTVPEKPNKDKRVGNLGSLLLGGDRQAKSTLLHPQALPQGGLEAPDLDFLWVTQSEFVAFPSQVCTFALINPLHFPTSVSR